MKRSNAGMLAYAMVAALAFAALPVSGLLPESLTPTAEASASKTSICHRTHSITNPYRRITVARSAVTGNSGHQGHNNAGVWTSSTASWNASPWGDIIPNTANGGQDSKVLNWSSAGQDVWFGTTTVSAGVSACKVMTPKQFYDAEVAAGRTAAEAVADLNDQSASEDVAVIAALGGSFSTSNISTADTVVTATTNAASSVAGTTATLNGSLTVGSTSTRSQFQYSTDSALATGVTTTTISGSGVTGSNQAVSQAITGLTSGTTYYFRVLGVTNYGLDTEGILYGSILSFTTGPQSQTITFSTVPTKTYGGSTFSLSASASSGLTVSFASQTTGACTVSGTTVTIVSAGTCTMRASQAGGSSGASTYTAAANVDQSFTISPKSLTITADNKSITVGDADPAFTFAASGLVSPDAIAAPGVTYTYVGTGSTPYASSTSVPSSAAAGTYSNTPSAAVFSTGNAANYTISYTAGTYVVNPAGSTSQTITFNPPSPQTFGDSGVTATATASSGLTVTFTSTTTAVCTVSGTAVTIVSAGLCTLRASQSGGTSGSTTYSSATDVDRTFPIAQKSLTITSIARSITVGDPSPTFAVTTSGLVSSDSIASATHTFAGSGSTSYSSSTTVPTTTGTYSDTPSAAVFGAGSASNYLIAYAPATYTISAPPTATKVTICHRTHATTNPYVLITVSVNSIIGAGGINGHQDHDTTRTNKVNPITSSASGSGPYQSGAAYPANQKWWGDIIPSFTYSSGGSSAYFAGLNWGSWGSPTPASGIIDNAAFSAVVTGGSSGDANLDTVARACAGGTSAVDTPEEYFDVEVTAGETPSDVHGELVDLDPEPGGNPLGAIPTEAVLTNGRTVVTDAASSLAKTTATLNGTLKPSGPTWASWRYEWGTSVSSVLGGTGSSYSYSSGVDPGSSIGSGQRTPSKGITGLTCATTYYYRVIGLSAVPASYYGGFVSFATASCTSGGTSPGGSGSSGGGSSSSSPTPSTPTSLPAAAGPVKTPDTEKVKPGQQVTLVGGLPVDVEKTKNDKSTKVELTGSDFKVNIGGQTTEGKELPLSEAGAPVVTPGQDLVSSGEGYAPGTEIELYILEPLTALGSFPVAADGTFGGSVSLPSTLPAGEYVVQMNGYSPGLEVRSVSFGLQFRSSTLILCADPVSRQRPAGRALSLLSTRARSIAARSGLLQASMSTIAAADCPASKDRIVQRPRKGFLLPAEIVAGRNLLLPTRVRMNSGQFADVSVLCSPVTRSAPLGDIAYCQTSRMGNKTYVLVRPDMRLSARVIISAPGNAKYAAYRYTKSYSVK